MQSHFQQMIIEFHSTKKPFTLIDKCNSSASINASLSIFGHVSWPINWITMVTCNGTNRVQISIRKKNEMKKKMNISSMIIQGVSMVEIESSET